MNEPSPTAAPTLEAIREARRQLGERVAETPTWAWTGQEADDLFGPDTKVFLKLELFQRTGTFKLRGALLNLLSLDEEQRRRGVTAVSAGNHAIAVACAASLLDSHAKVVMPESADPGRVERCRSYGGEVVLVPDVHRAFEEVDAIQRREGRTFVHPFEGFQTVLGTATVGLELCAQAPALDAVIVPIGGGGLCAGVACAVKALSPQTRVYGVEPEGADTMHRSFAAGEPQAIDKVRTIADSLGAPHAAPYTYSLCRQFVDGLVKVDDDALRNAMRSLFSGMKLAVEPAAAAAMAALRGPLAETLAGRRVGLIVCGSNISLATYQRLLAG
jgi:threonine dehydratase